MKLETVRNRHFILLWGYQQSVKHPLHLELMILIYNMIDRWFVVLCPISFIW